MPRGVPKAGFRMTKNRMKSGSFKMTKTGQKAQAAVKQVFAKPVKKETDAQVRAKLTDAFDTMHKIANGSFTGDCRSFIISGPPGLGKSYGVTEVAAEHEKSGRKVCVVSGFIRATGLYKVLYEYRTKNSVIIFDDSDRVFWDDIAIGILKHACDMTRVRKIDWRAETNMKDELGEDMPTSFEFEGSIIFITNENFDELIAKKNKNTAHFEALISRSIYMRLPIETRQDYMVRIAMVVEGGMLKNMGLSEFDAAELMMFIDKNSDKLRELSLRMVLKLGGFMKMDRKEWQKLARNTCFTSRDCQ